MAARHLADQEYWDELLEEPLPSAIGLTVRDLLNFWSACAGLAMSYAARLPPDRELTPEKGLSTLRDYAIGVERSSILKALVRLLKTPVEKAERALDFLTFTKSVRADLWTEPLVRVGNEILIVPFAMFSPNLSRCVELWMSRGGLSMERRGELFERHIRLSLREAFARCPLGRRLWMHPRAFGHSGETEEEIDIMFMINTRLYVGELKCVRDATEPIEDYRTLDRLTHGAEQARRKSDVVRHDLRPFMDECQPPHTPEDIHPIVITNTGLFCGAHINDVPIIDARVLLKFFEDGTLTDYLVMKDGAPVKEKARRLYTREELAHHDFSEYISYPPQLEFRRNAISEVTYSLPYHSTERAIEVAVPQVQLDQWAQSLGAPR